MHRLLYAAARRVESFIGMMFCWAVCSLTGMGVIALWAWMFSGGDAGDRRIRLIAALTAPAALGLLWLNLRAAVSIWMALQTSQPLGIAAAELSPRWPRVIQPVVALWWLLHFAAGVFAGFMFELTSYDHPGKHAGYSTGMEMPDTWGNFAFITLLAFGMSFAGNTFLLQAVSVFTKKHETLRRAWSYRLLIDAAVTLAPLALIKAGVKP